MEQDLRLDLQGLEGKRKELARRGGQAAVLSGPVGLVGCIQCRPDSVMVV